MRYGKIVPYLRAQKTDCQPVKINDNIFLWWQVRDNQDRAVPERCELNCQRILQRTSNADFATWHKRRSRNETQYSISSSLGSGAEDETNNNELFIYFLFSSLNLISPTSKGFTQRDCMATKLYNLFGLRLI